MVLDQHGQATGPSIAGRARRVAAVLSSDWTIAAVLFVVSAAIGSWYVATVVRGGGQPKFYQEQFGPAVMFACGYGYVNPDAAHSPALDAFLQVHADEIVCGDDLSRLERLPLTSMQRAFRYLMTTVGLTWRLERRVAWSALLPLYALIYGITIAVAYGLFRQGMGRLIAAGAAGALATSTLNMMYLAHLRDYAKAPFVIGLVLLAVLCVDRRRTPRQLLIVAAAAGVLTGIGVGFRNDLLVAVPAFVVALVAFSPLRGREHLMHRAGAAAAYLVAFVVALSPMLTIYTTGGGNSSQHLVLLGLGEPFTQSLGIDEGGLYDWGYDYRDELAHAMISGYADQRFGDHRYLPLYSADYDKAATHYLADVAVNFPADMLLRLYASSLKILELPYRRGETLQPPRFVSRSVLLKAYGARMKLLHAAAPVWPWTILFTLVALSVFDLRLGLFAALTVLYLSGYPALQFHERHYFHLEFIGWWAFAFTLAQLARACRAALSADRRAAYIAAIRPAIGWRRAWTGTAVVAGLLAVALVAPLSALRAYQQRHVRGLLQAYVDAPEQPLMPSRTPLGNGWTRIEGLLSTASYAGHERDDAVHAEYFVVDVGGARCGLLKTDMTFRYTATEPNDDFSRTMQLRPPAPPHVTHVFFPAYRHNPRAQGVRTGYALTAIEVPDAAVDCVDRVSRVRDPRALPVLMTLRLPPGWQDATLYGTLAGFEQRFDGDQPPAVYTFPEDLTVPRNAALSPIQPSERPDVVSRSGRVELIGSGWRVAGLGSRFTYLAEAGPAATKRAKTVFAHGRLERGAASFGLVRLGKWVAQVNVTTPGEFIAVVQAPDDAEYEAALDSYVLGASLRYDVVIDRAGWIVDPVQQLANDR